MPIAVFRRLPLFVLSITLLCGSAMADPEVIHNGSEPAEGLVTVGMTELWRAGGEDDDIFFGTVAAVRTDAEGRIYLLDGQLAQVHIYSPDGEHLRTIGHEGDGPGEVRDPGDMFITDDGTIHLLQGFPGRIVKLTPDGLPAGETTFKAGPDNSGQFGVLIAGLTDGRDMILAGIRMTFGGSVSKQTYFLSRCDADGMQKAALLEKENEVNFADLTLDELATDFVWQRMAVGPEGRVFAGPDRNAYLINVYGLDGGIERIITREYTASQRDEAQKKKARQVLEAVGANYPQPPRVITIEETEPVLGSLAVTGDGRLWAQTDTGDRNTPPGTWVVLDVFDPQGGFQEQVALRGDHDPTSDSLHILPDGRVIVVTGSLDAWLNQQGAGGESDAAAEDDPLEIICYHLDW